MFIIPGIHFTLGQSSHTVLCKPSGNRPTYRSEKAEHSINPNFYTMPPIKP